MDTNENDRIRHLENVQRQHKKLWIERFLGLFVKIEGLGNYKIAKYPVTQAVWKEVIGQYPTFCSFEGDCLPVENVNWDKCQKFIATLNGLLSEVGETGTFRLPTEKEWEYAAKGGSRNENFTHAGSDTFNEVAWYKENSNGRTHSVGEKKPNILGLYDMSGNVWEWCDVPDLGEKAVRGGSWQDEAKNCSITSRQAYYPTAKWYDIGFRLVYIP